MRYREYATSFLQHSAIAEVRAYGEVIEGGESFPLLMAESPGRRTLLVTSGFHGDEIAGPMTLLAHLPDIVAYARARDVGLVVYPCINPSGFDDRTRYNRSGESPNNDFLRYEIAPDTWVGELERGQAFLRHQLFTEGPKETRALRAELEARATPHAALDIHQDPWLPGELSYAYNFGDNAPFRPLLAASQPHVPVARAAQVDDDVHTDEDGLIQLHDGSVTDYFHRRGAPWTAALETTTSTPLDRCHRVNMIWILGFIDLVAQR